MKDILEIIILNEVNWNFLILEKKYDYFLIFDILGNIVNRLINAPQMSVGVSLMDFRKWRIKKTSN